MSVDSTDLKKQVSRHWFVRCIDFVIVALRKVVGPEKADTWLGIRLCSSAIIKLAQKDLETDLFPFADDEKSCLLAFHNMILCLKEEAQLSPTGQFLCVQKLRNALRTRLHLRILIAKHPAILEEKITEPVFIIGLPRSGTTLLHRSLAETKYFQYLTLQNTLDPFAQNRGVDSKYTVIRTILRRLCGFRWRQQDLLSLHSFLLRFLAPTLTAIHDCQLNQAEEESVLLDMSFTSQLTEAMFNVPTFSTYLETVDVTPMYLFLKKVLQIRQWTHFMSPKKPWLLKSPNHLEWIPTLLHVFPDARLLYPQRAVHDCYLSTVSASAHARRIFSDVVSTQEVAQQWHRKFLHLVHKCQSQGNVCVINYQALVTSPSFSLIEIFHFLKVVDWGVLPETKPYKKNHKYTHADLGISEKDLFKLPLVLKFTSK